MRGKDDSVISAEFSLGKDRVLELSHGAEAFSVSDQRIKRLTMVTFMLCIFCYNKIKKNVTSEGFSLYSDSIQSFS